MRRLFEIFRTDEDTGIGLEPLLYEFAYEVYGLSDEEKQNRAAKITAYYKAIYDRSKGNLYLAYGKTRDWAKKIFVAPYVKKQVDKASAEAAK